MQEETKKAFLSMRERLVSIRDVYSGRFDKYSERGNSFTSTVDASYWNGITSGVSVAINSIDEEIQGLGMSGKEEGSTGQEQEG